MSMIPQLRRLAARSVPILSLMFPLLAFALPAAAFDFDSVAARARALAAQPYDRPDPKLPKELTGLGLDDYHDIRFKPDKALWHSAHLPFELQFFHPGSYYDQTVRINLVDDGAVRALRLNPDDFDYGRNAGTLDKSQLRGIGFSGFRVHYPLNTKNYKDELIEFQGASYFRALGRDQHYGLSARGLAIDTGLLSGEEFPSFTDFWIVKPARHDKQLVIYALLDSRRATGAYRFTVRPGDSTLVDVQTRLYLRENVGKLGIAPLTSMYLYGENQPAGTEQRYDYRPEVHDSDGLQIETAQEWIWRPLVNPKRLLITSFSATDPRGFGLMQRDRDFRDYEDLDSRYELRPGVWVAPKGKWGAGRVELVQIPTPDDTNDNVVAYWVPDQQPKPLQALNLAYTLSWEMRKPTHPPTSWVMQTRRLPTADGSIRFLVDFVGPALEELPADAPVISGVWIGDNGQLLDRQLRHNDATGGWRLTLRVKRLDDNKPVELRAFLRKTEKKQTENISETWAYILPAQSLSGNNP